MKNIIFALIASTLCTSLSAVVIIREPDCAKIVHEPQDPAKFERRGNNKQNRENKNPKPPANKTYK